jgi:hypothetical protein
VWSNLKHLREEVTKKILNQPTEYFVQTHIDGTCFAYYRKRYEKNGLYEEIWLEKAKHWKHIPGQLIWMQISGECTLAQVSYEQSKQLLQVAFKDEEENK